MQKSRVKTLPDEIIIDNQRITKSEDIAQKLNIYFTSVAAILNDSHTDALDLDNECIKNFVNDKVHRHTFLSIPYITTEQVFAYMNKLEPTKATGLDGLGPSFLKNSDAVIEPSIAILINKSIDTGIFPSQRKQADFKGSD